VALARFLDVRSVILTSTVALQGVYAEEMASAGMCEVKGQQRYVCIAAPDFDLPHDTTVAGAPCHAGVKCELRGNSCLYYGAVRRAQHAKLVATSYAFWMSSHEYGDGLGENIGLLVCDEAHDAPEQITKHLGAEFDGFEFTALLKSEGPKSDDMDDWRAWATPLVDKIGARISTISASLSSVKPDKDDVRLIRELKFVQRKLTKVANAKGDWIVDRGVEGKTRSVELCPVWPMEYAADTLFKNIPKVVFMSATVRPKTMAMLGLKESDYDFIECPSTFPPSRRRIFSVPTVRMNHRNTPDDLKLMCNRVDELVNLHDTHKGILHSVSYDRQKLIVTSCDMRDVMLTHNRKNIRWEIEKFRKAKAPALMVSPSMHTGYDFPHDACRYQILVKLPWPDMRNPLVAARAALDPEYIRYEIAQTVEQACGRSSRAEDDWSRTYIIDDNFRWFFWQNQHFFSQGFRDAVVMLKPEDGLPNVPKEWK
jgi:Rad3-related DNA helicase